MLKFTKNEQKELKELLYDSYDHDAKIKNINYNGAEALLRIEIFNPYFHVKTSFHFSDVKMVLATRGNELGSREEIVSLTVEDDFSYLQKYIPQYDEVAGDGLYLLFQMFSADELHIVAKEVHVEIAQYLSL